MERTISLIFGFLASLLGFYSLLIIIRIILTWFAHVRYSRPAQILSRVTDPYLNWWRNKFNLRAGILDLSPIVAMTALSVLQMLCADIARRGRLSAGVVIIVLLSAVRSAASFILGFCLIVIVLRLFAYFAKVNIYNPFWQIVDTISRPLLYRINRIIFGKRMVKYTTGIITAIAVLSALWVVFNFGLTILSSFLLGIMN